jgi:Spy/CpxP family protein refolding chaperone
MKKSPLFSCVLAVVVLSAGTLGADQTPTNKPHGDCWFVRHAEKIGLNLTEKQEAALDGICKEAHLEVRGVLTAAQIKILQDAKGKGHEAIEAAWKQIEASLTAEQKTKIHEIRKARWLQIEAVLTADQLAKLKEWRKDHHEPHLQPGA